jgi:hypothetical protein
MVGACASFFAPPFTTFFTPSSPICFSPCLILVIPTLALPSQPYLPSALLALYCPSSFLNLSVCSSPSLAHLPPLPLLHLPASPLTNLLLLPACMRLPNSFPTARPHSNPPFPIPASAPLYFRTICTSIPTHALLFHTSPSSISSRTLTFPDSPRRFIYFPPLSLSPFCPSFHLYLPPPPLRLYASLSPSHVLSSSPRFLHNADPSGLCQHAGLPPSFHRLGMPPLNPLAC